MKLTLRLTLVFMLYALALLAIVAWLAYNSGKESLRSATVSELQSTAIEKQAALDEWVEEKRTDISSLAASPTTLESAAALFAAPRGSAEAREARAKFVKEVRPRVDGGEFVVVMLLDPSNGQVIAATDPTEEGKFKENRLFFLNGRNAPYVQSVYYSISLQGPAMTAAAPVLSTDGKLLGVLAGRLNLEKMNAIINRRAGLWQTDEAFLVNTSNLFVTQPRLSPNTAVLRQGVYSDAIIRCQAETNGTISALDYRKIPALIVYHWLPEHDLCLIVKIDQAEALGPAFEFGRKVVLISAIALLGATVLGVLFSRGITRPIREMQSGVIRFGQGESDIRLPESSRDELGDLAREFNRMAASLVEKDARLHEYATELERKVEERTEEIASLSRFPTENPNPVLRILNNGQITYANTASQKLLDMWGCEINAYLPAEWKELIAETVKSGSDKTVDVPCNRFVYSIMIVPVSEAGYVNLYGRDITGRRRAEQALFESEEKYRLIADNSNDWIYWIKPDRNFRYVSPSCKRITGFTHLDFMTNPHLFTEIVHPEDRERIETHTEENRDETIAEPLEYRIITKAGVVRWISHSCAPLYSTDGKSIGRRGTNRDITDRKRAEVELHRTLEELKASNTELEQFAYVASHDLQEPLRGIAGLAQLLQQRYHGQLDSQADEFIDLIVDGTQRMQTLINDLLAYSRIGRRGEVIQPTDTEEALMATMKNLDVAIREYGARITHESLPTVKADATQLIQLFQNLIGNAIKFRSERPPEIHIGVTDAGDFWQFSVHDNGIGIEPQYFERVFQVFQRLHTRREYKGTGIGLAICKKIIERHRGKIWVESEPGVGATFYFTLPKGN
jgi:PAS domain S-box-containing protein